MLELDCNEMAILALLALRPISYIPPQPCEIARRLESRGLVAFSQGQWHPTPQGFDLARSLH
jgi:hypothetical protein